MPKNYISDEELNILQNAATETAQSGETSKVIIRFVGESKKAEEVLMSDFGSIGIDKVTYMVGGEEVASNWNTIASIEFVPEITTEELDV